MKITKVIVIEDSIAKYMDISMQLKKMGISQLFSARNAEGGIAEIEKAQAAGDPYDLLISDMHFDYFGTNDRNAGEKTMEYLRDHGIEIPVIFCSSSDWRIPGSVGSVYYHPDRDWETELSRLIKSME